MNTLHPSTKTPSPPSPPSFLPEKGRWRTLFFVGAAVAHTINSALTLPFVAVAVAHLATIVAVKLLHHHDPEQTKTLLKSVLRFKERHPNLQAVAFAITLITSFVFGILGCIFGILTGIYAGLVINTDYLKDFQSTNNLSPQTVNA